MGSFGFGQGFFGMYALGGTAPPEQPVEASVIINVRADVGFIEVTEDVGYIDVRPEPGLVEP